MTALPYFIERIAAGFPSPAQGYLEAPLDLNQLCIRQQEATFLLRVEGDSMVEAGIFPDDILIVDRSLEASHGDVVVVSLNGEFTVKELRLTPTPMLVPRNSRYAVIPLAEQACEMFGVVTFSFRAHHPMGRARG
ncbi:MAG: translesion error-prone DNA polymerase V autoproteolytic subunit [Pseudomonadota bacterium]|nr:translesion error-prone DNA polymerase V autoproteolytic subunit [Pseudomonadota bacterium]